MKLAYVAALMVAGIACISVDAPAGQKVPSEVSILNSAGSYSVSGSLPGARNSADSKQRIGCQLATSAGSTTISGRCEAANAQGQYAQCGTTAPHLLEVIKAIDSGSLLYFRYDPLVTMPGGGLPECASITLDKNSLYEPKNP
ncbi:hypothetical protein [Pseudomonas sp. CGJS7]|uniref:hypothetical protein n=1 Tax=Pseudomonas sp. CGJS7 TaxID=3109348 RepID=UPI00300B04DC